MVVGDLMPSRTSCCTCSNHTAARSLSRVSWVISPVVEPDQSRIASRSPAEDEASRHLIGQLIHPRTDVLLAVPDVLADPAAGRAVALGAPLIERRNRNAEIVRDVLARPLSTEPRVIVHASPFLFKPRVELPKLPNQPQTTQRQRV